MPTEIGSYMPHTQEPVTVTYDPEPRRSNNSFNTCFFDSRDNWVTDLTWTVPQMNPFEGFHYDWESIALGFQPSTNAKDFFEEPRPMKDLPPNL